MIEKSPISENVQSLIDKLHLEGVKAGTDEGKELLEEAQKKAEMIVQKAHHEADMIREEMDELIEKEKKASHEAIQIAFRDAVLTLKSQLFLQFKTHLQNLISEKLSDDKFLGAMLFEITRSSLSDKDESIEILVSEIENSEEKIHNLINKVASNMFNNGIRLGKSGQKGISISFKDDQIEIDLTEEALTDLIYSLVIPKYRDYLDGI